MEGNEKVPQIYQALVAVMAELGKIGISKDRKNEQQNYRFRGIDDVLNAVNPAFAKHGVWLQISYDDNGDTERVTGKGSTLIHSRVLGHFTFVCAADASSVTVAFPGTGMDSADKALNKAMSAALKYCLLQSLMVPTESTEDADATTPEPSVPKPPDGFTEWFTAIVAEADRGFEAIREAWKESPEVYRTYAMTMRGTEWAAAKKHATEVTTAMKKAAAEAAEKPAKAAK